VAAVGAGVDGAGANSSGALLALSPCFFFSVAKTSNMSCEKNPSSSSSSARVAASLT